MCKHFHLTEATFSTGHRRFRSRRHNRLRNQRLFELKSQKKVLAVWGAAQDGSVEQGHRARQLSLVYKGDRYLQSKVGAGLQKPFGGKKNTARRKIQGRGELQKLLTSGLSSADEKGNRNGQTIPVTAFRDWGWTTHLSSPFQVTAPKQPKCSKIQSIWIQPFAAKLPENRFCWYSRSCKGLRSCRRQLPLLVWIVFHIMTSPLH